MFKCKCKCSRDFPEEPLRNAFGKKGDPLLDWAVGKPDAQRPGIAVGFQGGQTTPSISARNSGRKGCQRAPTTVQRRFWNPIDKDARDRIIAA